MTTDWVLVTPQLAAKWLEANKHNRRLRQRVVDRYAGDMLNGRWYTTHQGIAFDAVGDLSDGQHRLAAIVQSGKAVNMLVTRGLQAEAQRAIDDGIRRSLVDASTLGWIDKMTTFQSAITLRMEAGMLHEVASKQALLAFAQKHWAAISFTASLFPTRLARVTIGAMAGAIARAYYHVSHEDLTRFAQVLTTGMSEYQYDRTVISLRNNLQATRSRGFFGNVFVYCKTERAIVAFVNKEVLTKIYASDKELFELPEESESADFMDTIVSDVARNVARI